MQAVAQVYQKRKTRDFFFCYIQGTVELKNVVIINEALQVQRIVPYKPQLPNCSFAINKDHEEEFETSRSQTNFGGKSTEFEDKDCE